MAGVWASSWSMMNASTSRLVDRLRPMGTPGVLSPLGELAGRVGVGPHRLGGLPLGSQGPGEVVDQLAELPDPGVHSGPTVDASVTEMLTSPALRLLRIRW